MKIIRHNDSVEYFRGVHDGYEAGVDDGFSAARKAFQKREEKTGGEAAGDPSTSLRSTQDDTSDGMIGAAEYELKWVRKEIVYFAENLAKQTMTPADQREGQLKGLGAAVAIIDRELELCKGKFAPAGNPRREEG